MFIIIIFNIFIFFFDFCIYLIMSSIALCPKLGNELCAATPLALILIPIEPLLA